MHIFIRLCVIQSSLRAVQRASAMKRRSASSSGNIFTHGYFVIFLTRILITQQPFNYVANLVMHIALLMCGDYMGVVEVIWQVRTTVSLHPALATLAGKSTHTRFKGCLKSSSQGRESNINHTTRLWLWLEMLISSFVKLFRIRNKCCLHGQSDFEEDFVACEMSGSSENNAILLRSIQLFVIGAELVCLISFPCTRHTPICLFSIIVFKALLAQNLSAMYFMRIGDKLNT